MSALQLYISKIRKGNVTQTVKGQAANSASPSDVLLITWNPANRIKIANNVILKATNAFAKVFINIDKLISSTKTKNFKTGDIVTRTERIALDDKGNKIKGYLSNKSLDYEYRFYNEIIKPILDFNISPHFIRYYGINEFDNYKDYSEYYNLNLSNVSRNLYYMYNEIKDRPSIDDNKSIVPATDYFSSAILPNIEIKVLLLQSIDPTNTVTFEKFYKKLLPAGTTGITAIVCVEILVVLFQAAQALYALELSRATHNDLHSGNIWITKRTNIFKKIVYVIDDKTYGIKTDICVKIFDFDRAYSLRLKTNEAVKNNSYLCKISSQCSYISRGKDFIKLLSYLIGHLKTLNLDRQEGEIPIDEFIELLISFAFKTDDTLLSKYNREKGTENMNFFLSDISKSEFDEQLHDMPTIINSIYEQLNNASWLNLDNTIFNKIDFSVDEIDSTYVCKASSFNDSGNIVIGSTME